MAEVSEHNTTVLEFNGYILSRLISYSFFFRSIFATFFQVVEPLLACLPDSIQFNSIHS